MAGPLDGIRVVELAIFVAGPAVGALLADWGADVVKIESPQGDPWRHNFVGKPVPGLETPVFELANRGKRSIVLDLKTSADHATALELIATADMFVTNLRPAALARINMATDILHAQFPKLIILEISGYGLTGPDADRPGYDTSAFWVRAGHATAIGEPGQPPVLSRAGLGDHSTALAGAAAVLAALYRRSATGDGDVVHVSLAGTGAYVNGLDHIGLLQGGRNPESESRQTPVNPLFNTYRMRDDRWIMLACLQGDRHLPDVALAIDRRDLIADERFIDARSRYRNNRALVSILDDAFAQRTFEQWAPVLDAHDIIWGPINTAEDAQSDPQYEALGAFPAYNDLRINQSVRTVDSPVHFRSAPRTIDRGAPTLGEHSAAIRREIQSSTEPTDSDADRGTR